MHHQLTVVLVVQPGSSRGGDRCLGAAKWRRPSSPPVCTHWCRSLMGLALQQIVTCTSDGAEAHSIGGRIWFAHIEPELHLFQMQRRSWDMEEEEEEFQKEEQRFQASKSLKKKLTKLCLCQRTWHNERRFDELGPVALLCPVSLQGFFACLLWFLLHHAMLQSASLCALDLVLCNVH